MSRSPRCFPVFLTAMHALGCSATGGAPSLAVGSESNGGAANGAGGAAAINLGDAGRSRALAAHVEENQVVVGFVKLTCTDACADVVAVATGGYAPYAYRWEDGSTNPARHLCPSSTTGYQVSVTDTGTASGEFSRPPETVEAPLTADVLECPDGGVSDVGADGGVGCNSAAFAPRDGIYSGTFLDRNLGGLPAGNFDVTLAKDGRNRYHGALALALAGLVPADVPLDGLLDCRTGELVLRGTEVGNGDDGRLWVIALTYAAAAQTISGDYAVLCVPGAITCSGVTVVPSPPTPHEQVPCGPAVPSCVGPVGDSGTFTSNWKGP